MVTQKEDTESLMAYMGAAFARIDLRTFKFISFNDAMYHMIGYTKEEYENTFHDDMNLYFHDEYSLQLQKLKDACAKAQQEGVDKFRINMIIPAKNKTLHVAGAGLISTYGDKGETIPCLTVLYRDVTDLFETELELEKVREEEQVQIVLTNENRRMQGVLDGVPGGLSTIRVEDGIVVSMRLNKWFQD